MAIDYITDTRTQEQSVDTDQHLIVTATGSIVATSSDGIGISDPSTVHIQTSIYGSVYGQLKGIAFGTSDTTAFIGETGIVEGGVTGLETGENGVVTNNGQIKGGLQGILANYINASITNGGSVVGSVGIEGDFDFGDNTRFTNTGTVTGLSHGVLLYRNSLITNDGIIQALGGNASIGISVKTFQDVFDPDANVATVTNRGTIIGDYAIEGDSGVEQITNLGTLQGKVALLDGDDLYDGRGGFVSGIVDLGDGADTAFGGDGTEQMLGGNGDDRLSGGGGADILSGGTGSDRLDGGTGADEMTGGDDDDTYVVDDAGDVVTETANGGTDTVESSISHILADSVENLVLTGSADLSGIGNAAANVIVGNSGNNYLYGGAGADDLRGGAGNDTYVVDDAADAVTEVADGGIDTVQASVSFTLAANVENLHLTGAGDIDGSGNALANIINGNAGNNVLDGGGGADQLRGGAGNDTYVVDHESDAVFEMAGDGVDTVQASISFTLAADVENLSLTGTGAINGTGNAQANIVTGNAGDNLLDGGAGADALSGGGGGDTYIVDNAGDTVAEAANEGDDTVRASVSFTLGADIENLILTGSANIAGAGNGLANVLIGNTGNNILTGAGGDDQIDGGEGHDTALFSGQSSDYQIIVNLDGTVNVNGADGNDTLRSIESLRFDDGTFSVKFPAAPTVVGSVAPVNENAPANTVVATLHANTLAGESVRYVLDDDIDGKFAIDSGTGVITLIGAVDYEADFQDDPNLMTTADGLRKYYVLQVKAVSADGLALSSATVPLNVYVNNVNEAPATLSFTDGSTTATVDGAVGNGAVVGTLMASDPDGDTQLVYSFELDRKRQFERRRQCRRPVQDRRRQIEVRAHAECHGSRILHRHAEGHRQEWRPRCDVLLQGLPDQFQSRRHAADPERIVDRSTERDPRGGQFWLHRLHLRCKPRKRIGRHGRHLEHRHEQHDHSGGFRGCDRNGELYRHRDHAGRDGSRQRRWQHRRQRGIHDRADERARRNRQDRRRNRRRHHHQ